MVDMNYTTKCYSCKGRKYEHSDCPMCMEVCTKCKGEGTEPLTGSNCGCFGDIADVGLGHYSDCPFSHRYSDKDGEKS